MFAGFRLLVVGGAGGSEGYRLNPLLPRNRRRAPFLVLQLPVGCPRLRRFNWTPGVDVCYTAGVGLGIVGDQPVVTVGGMIGVYRASNLTFYFDQDGNKQWTAGDVSYPSFALDGELSIRASR